jgi:hypothetical protein
VNLHQLQLALHSSIEQRHYAFSRPGNEVCRPVAYGVGDRLNLLDDERVSFRALASPAGGNRHSLATITRKKVLHQLSVMDRSHSNRRFSSH